MLELPDGYDENAAAQALQEWFGALNLGSFIDAGMDAQVQWTRLSHSDPEHRPYYTGRYEALKVAGEVQVVSKVAAKTLPPQPAPAKATA